VEEGALYPALHRLEGRGLLAASWGPSETGRRAKSYRLTRAGAAHLRKRIERWRELSGAVDAVLREAAP
jgi:DNA-binding PadR family transcriptional regulator